MMFLKAKPRNKQTAIIEIDESLRGVLPVKTLRNFSLTHNQTSKIDPALADQIDKLISSYAWQRFLSWLAFQERSIGESRDYLAHFPMADDLAEILIDKAVSARYIDDERCARLMIESLMENFKSRQEIKSKLFLKKLPPEIFEPILTELYDQNANNDILEALINRLYERNANLEPDKRKKKIINYLANRGFSYYDISDFYERIVYEKEYQSQ